jgi:hypothetical protein
VREEEEEGELVEATAAEGLVPVKVLVMVRRV